MGTVSFTTLPVPQVTLQDHVEVAGEDSEAITAFLENKVEYMIQKANSRAVGGRDNMLPLIRLRVRKEKKRNRLRLSASI